MSDVMARPMKLFIWRDVVSFLAVAHDVSIQQARRALLDGELGGGGDGSCPERDKARRIVETTQPDIWYGAVHAFVLTDSAELREQEDLTATLEKRIKELETQLRAAEESNGKLREAAEELLTVARLRGDNEIPHPVDDPKGWSARMQTAWTDLAALASAPTQGEGIRDTEDSPK